MSWTVWLLMLHGWHWSYEMSLAPLGHRGHWNAIQSCSPFHHIGKKHRWVSLLRTLVAYRSAVSRKSCLLNSSKASTSCWIRVRSGTKGHQGLNHIEVSRNTEQEGTWVRFLPSWILETAWIVSFPFHSQQHCFRAISQPPAPVCSSFYVTGITTKHLSFSSAQVAQIDGLGYFLFYLARLSQMWSLKSQMVIVKTPITQHGFSYIIWINTMLGKETSIY